METPNELPTPTPSRIKSHGLSFVTFLLLLGLGGGAYWFSRDEDTQKKLQNSAINIIKSTVADTPLAALTNLFTPSTPSAPPPPPSVVNPSTAPGTLSGQHIQSPVGTPPHTSNTVGNTSPALSADNIVVHASQEVKEEQKKEHEAAYMAAQGADLTEERINDMQNDTSATPTASSVQEDTIVPLPFVKDVAQWMARSYSPKNGVRWNLSTINMRYGQKMHTLVADANTDILKARDTFLRYAFHPSMLNALYTLYIDRFVKELGTAAMTPSTGKALTVAQTKHMYTVYAAYFTSLSSVLRGISTMPDFVQRMHDMDTMSVTTVEIHARIAEAVFALDTARENNNSSAQQAAQERIDTLNVEYQQVLAQRKAMRNSFVQTLKNTHTTASSLDNDTVMFMAKWVERRQQQDANAIQSAGVAAGLLQKLSVRLTQAGNTLP